MKGGQLLIMNGRVKTHNEKGSSHLFHIKSMYILIAYLSQPDWNMRTLFTM